MTKFKAIFTDIDGTLLNSKRIVDEKTILAISQLKSRNIKFGIATGRPVKNIKHLIESWKIIDYVDYIIGINGVEVYDVLNDKQYNNYFLEPSKIQEIYNISKDLPCSTIVYDKDLIVSSNSNDLLKFHSNKVGYDYHIVDFNDYTKNTYPKMLLMANKEYHDEIICKIKEISGISIFQSADYLLEVVDERVNKSYGINIIKNLLKLDNNEIVTFGDQLNDLEMINDYYGVAMGNAIDEIKNVSKYVTDSNDESGIAKFIFDNIF